MEITIHPEGKIIDPRYKWKGATDLFGSIDRSDVLPANKELFKRLITDAKLGMTIEKGAKKKIGLLRQVKYFQDLKKLDAYFKKPLNEVTQEDMQSFILDLEEGIYTKKNGKPYSNETQVCIKKIIIKFYKWVYGCKKDPPPIVAWIDTSYNIKDYKVISEEQALQIASRIRSNDSDGVIRNRAIIMFLMDSGARADEFLNIRLHHLTIENGNYKVRIEFSKTKARTIFLPKCKQYIDEWLAVHPAKNESLVQLFPMRYNALCNIVKRAGDTINWKLTPQSLRHASATYYARHLSRYQFCYRYGWAMSSRQPDRYIDKEGLGQEKMVETVQADGVQKLQQENSQLNRRLAMMEEQMNRLLQADKEEVRKIIGKCVGGD